MMHLITILLHYAYLHGLREHLGKVRPDKNLILP